MPTRYAVFLRGVMPTNLRMPDFKRALETLGYLDVVTILASGNAVFTARTQSEKKLEAAIQKALPKFTAFVRSIEHLQALVESKPFAKVPPERKQIVTFLKEAPKVKAPVVMQDARIFAVVGCDAFTEYVRHPGDPIFMRLIAKTLPEENTTRTWETVKKVIARS